MTEKKNTTGENNMQKKTAPKTKNTTGKIKRTRKKTKSTNTKAATTTKKKAVSVKETPVQKTTEQEKTRFWKEAIKNIATGADVVVDHASEVGGQASEVMVKSGIR